MNLFEILVDVKKLAYAFSDLRQFNDSAARLIFWREHSLAHPVTLLTQGRYVRADARTSKLPLVLTVGRRLKGCKTLLRGRD